MDVNASEIRKFVLQNFLFGEDDGFRDNDSFLELGIIDSTGVLELVHFLESRYNVQIDDEELVPDNLDSIDRIVRFLNQKA